MDTIKAVQSANSEENVSWDWLAASSSLTDLDNKRCKRTAVLAVSLRSRQGDCHKAHGAESHESESDPVYNPAWGCG